MTNENQNPIEYASYQQVNLPRNETALPDFARRINGKIVLLSGIYLRNFIRGRVYYNEQEDAKALFLEYAKEDNRRKFRRKGVHRMIVHRKRIHLHDIEGLLVEDATE